MNLDAQNLYSQAQSVILADTVTAASTNLVDHGLGTTTPAAVINTRKLGVGEDMYLVVQVATTFTGATGTLVVVQQTDDNAAFSSPLTTITVGTFPALSVAGTRFVHKLPAFPANQYERFTRLFYTCAGASGITAGTVTAFLTHDIDASSVQYGKNYNIIA